MARTTINLDGPVPEDRKIATAPAVHLQWTSRPMGALVDLDDNEALFAALDEPPRKPVGGRRNQLL